MASKQASQVSRRTALTALLAAATAGMAGCATLMPDPPIVQVVSIEPMPGQQQLEWRFAVKLRVQNPNDREFTYDGVSFELYLNSILFASGVTDESGFIPRFGETTVIVPVIVPTLSAARAALGLAHGEYRRDVPYLLTGKLGGGPFGAKRFESKGAINLPGI